MRELLAFERRRWQHAGLKEQAIRRELGLSPIEYYQRLNATINDPGSLTVDAATVRRLLRIRSAAGATRA